MYYCMTKPCYTSLGVLYSTSTMLKVCSRKDCTRNQFSCFGAMTLVVYINKYLSTLLGTEMLEDQG